jgi:hypothetical protein
MWSNSTYRQVAGSREEGRMFSRLVRSSDDVPQAIGRGTRIVVAATGLVRILVLKHSDGDDDQRVLCRVLGTERLKFSTQADAELAITLMLAAGEHEYERNDEPQHDRVFFEVKGVRQL